MTTNSAINLNNTNASSTTFLRGDKTWVALGTVVSSNRPYASVLTLVNNTSTDIVSVSLSVGTWLVQGNCFWDWEGFPTGITIQSWINTSSVTPPNFSLQQYMSNMTSEFIGMNVPSTTVVVSSGTTTAYLSGAAVFASNHVYVCGNIIAVKIA